MNGYKKVTHIGKSIIHINKFQQKRDTNKLYKLSIDDYPELIEDLYITGAHSILVDTLTKKQEEETIKLLGEIYITDDKYRLMTYLDERATPCDKRISKLKFPYTIWHLVLENSNIYENYGIYANGLLVESCSQWSFEDYSNLH